MIRAPSLRQMRSIQKLISPANRGCPKGTASATIYSAPENTARPSAVLNRSTPFSHSASHKRPPTLSDVPVVIYSRAPLAFCCSPTAARASRSRANARRATAWKRWGRAVLQAGKNPLSLDELNRLHGVLIEDNRFIKAGLRPDGVFLGERDHNGDPLPEFIGARPEDLTALVTGMIAANDRMRKGNIDAVLNAAATAFGFVYIHPYQDGNGRLHRCLIHHVLADRKFTPPGMTFPVSSVMLDRIDDYRNTLRGHSGRLMEFIDWRPTLERNVEVRNDTADLYRYFDCTEAAEFLCACVARSVEDDLPQEIDYLRRQDEAERRIAEVVDMPDRLAQNLLMFMRQNGGVIPKRRRENEFTTLTDDEARKIEEIYGEVFSDGVSWGQSR